MPEQPFSFEEFKELYSQVPRLCVDLIIKGRDGFLLTLRAIEPNKGQWHLPGGTVLFKEPIEAAVARVAWEELRIEVEIDDFLGYIEYLKQNEAGGFDYPVSLVFACSLKSGEVKTNRQAAEARFFKRLPDNVIPEQADFIRRRVL